MSSLVSQLKSDGSHKSLMDFFFHKGEETKKGSFSHALLSFFQILNDSCLYNYFVDFFLPKKNSFKLWNARKLETNLWTSRYFIQTTENSQWKSSKITLKFREASF